MSDPAKLITPDRAANMLGVHRRTIRRWASEGEIAAVKVIGRWHIVLSDLEAKFPQLTETDKTDIGTELQRSPVT